MRVAALAVLGVCLAADLAAQELTPPKSSIQRGTRIGLFGFGVRGGFEVKKHGQLVIGSTLDVGNVISSRLRVRPSAEVGVFNGPNTYVGNFELLWRFTDDEVAATPYLGGGLGLAGREECGTDPKCPGLWLNLVFGFELHYRSTFNWLVEYHAMDAMRRHRVYVGLTTRRGN